jgi:putative endonuclease
MDHIKTGRQGEGIALDYLKNEGYLIVERNYRCHLGEIDIIAKEGNIIVFVEVKSRRSGSFGEPQEAVGTKKQKKLSMIALFYLHEKKITDVNARFDIVAVHIDSGEPLVELIRDAFDLCPGY